MASAAGPIDVRLGLVGCGRVAERAYLPALRLARGVRLVAVADLDPTRRSAPGLPAFATAEELLASVQVDALVLATPAAEHVADAALAAAARVATLVEKPPAQDAEQAAALAGLDPLPFVGFNRRFFPAFVRLRERLPAIGAIELELVLHNRRSDWLPYVVDDDALLDLGPHLVDLARWLTGSDVEEVRALELSAERVQLDLQLGRGHARVGCARDARYAERVVARPGGRAAIRPALERLRRPLGPSDFVLSFVRELEALAGATRGEPAESLATAADGLEAMLVIDRARDS